jgi:hypothetical protein
MNHKRIVLAALFVVLALCLVYAFVSYPRLEKAPPRAALSAARSGAAGAERQPAANRSANRPEVAEGRIDFAFLDAEVQPFPGAKRDLFRFASSPAGGPGPVAAVKPPPTVEQPTVEPPTVTAVEDAPPVVPIEVVRQSLSRFTFVGFLDKAGEKTVFLTSGGEMFLVKSGERFGVENEFTIDSIDGNLLRVRHDGRPDTIDIELIEQKDLDTALSAPASVPAVTAEPDRSASRVIVTRRRRPSAVAPEDAQESSNIDDENVRSQEIIPGDGESIEGEANGTNR